jgi:hypothetical protein
MEQRTYTRRENARRAGLAAGVPSERVVLTVHKNGDEVRFGWKEMPAASEVTTATPKTKPAPKVQHAEQNGVKRRKAGGVCAAVWTWLDANPGATAKEAMAAAPAHGWNPNNVACEFYAWRKLMGISCRSLDLT